MLNFNSDLREIADRYNALQGMYPCVRGHYVEVNHTLAREIALAYEALPEVFDDDMTGNAYFSLELEVMAQFRSLVDAGYTFQPWQQEGQPYKNSAEMMADVRENKHLWFFQGGEVHPRLGHTVVTLDGVGCSANDILRAVHDIFGHACEGFGFGQRGEENAWIHHSMMFSHLAQWALTSETRGQNSWVNESDVNAGLPACERAFAAQKTALLPRQYTLIPLEVIAQQYRENANPGAVSFHPGSLMSQL